MIVDDILLLAARDCGRKIAGLCARVKKAETKQPYDTDTARAVGAAVLRSILTELGYRPEFVDSALGANGRAAQLQLTAPEATLSDSP